MIVDLIDKTNEAIRRLRLVQMAVEDVKDRGQADALHEGAYLTSLALDELKQQLMAARSEGLQRN